VALLAAAASVATVLSFLFLDIPNARARWFPREPQTEAQRPLAQPAATEERSDGSISSWTRFGCLDAKAESLAHIDQLLRVRVAWRHDRRHLCRQEYPVRLFDGSPYLTDVQGYTFELSRNACDASYDPRRGEVYRCFLYFFRGRAVGDAVYLHIEGRRLTIPVTQPVGAVQPSN
jgi:hypothetical protein